MSPRPRTKGRESWPEGLRRHMDNKTGSTYYSWIDPRTGKEKSLKAKDDFKLAKQRAKQLNSAIAGIELDIVSEVLSTKSGMKFSKWATEYMHIIEHERSLKPNTIRSRKSLLNKWNDSMGNLQLSTIQTKHIAEAIKAEVKEGRNRQAQSMRSVIIDVFKEAKAAGEFPSDKPNPAIDTNNPKAMVTRARLAGIEEFNAILEQTSIRDPWQRNAMLMALVTGQAREDLSIARFKRSKDWYEQWELYQQMKAKQKTGVMPYSFVEDDHYYATRQKTGVLIRIPLDLRLDATGMTIGQVIKQCRDMVSQNILHHTRVRTHCDRGDAVHKDTVSRMFARARSKTDLTWIMEPPTFHEIRSLSERLYKEQGIDTQSLLGHKDARTTARYHDMRGADWVEVVNN